MRDAHKRVREATKQSAKTQKSYFDARTKALTFTKGQLVWLYWPKPLLRQQKRKLTRLWFGPYQIVDFKSEVVVQIKHVKTGKMQTVHVDRLMPCTSVTEIVSPRSSLSSTPSSSSRPAQPVVSVAPTSVEHQAPTTAPAPVSSSSLRPRRSIRRPARYLWLLSLHIVYTDTFVSHVLPLPTSGNRVKLLSLR